MLNLKINAINLVVKLIFTVTVALQNGEQPVAGKGTAGLPMDKV